MLKLIKTDLKRIIKDKLFIVALILSAIFAISNPILYKIIFSAIDMPDMDMDALGLIVYGKGMFFQSFSLSNNFGLILPIFIAIIIGKDYSYGTIRNKIITGHSRLNVFISIFISSSIVLCASILAHALLTLGVSSIFFKYQAEAFTNNDFLYLLESVGFQMLVYICIAALISVLCMISKSSGICIILYIAVMFIATLVGTVLTLGVELSLITSENELLRNVLNILIDINIFNSNTLIIGLGSSYNLTEVLSFTFGPIVITLILLALGVSTFNTKDLK